MADINYNDHAAKTAPTVDDFIPIWDVAAAQSKKATINNILNARLTGGGVVATGGFTLTLPATGTVMLLGQNQTVTGLKTFAPPSTSQTGILINMPAGATGEAIQAQLNGGNAARLRIRNDANDFTMQPRDLGNDVPGSLIQALRNTNAAVGTVGPAAGSLGLSKANGAVRFLWPDASDNLRIHTAQPTGSSGSPTVSDTAGTVVGTQTSMAAAKHIMDELSPLGDVAARVRAGAEAVRRFVYRSGAFGGQEFEGVVTDLAPAYGMDRDEEQPAGKSLNEIQILGDLLRMVDGLARRVAELEGRG